MIAKNNSKYFIANGPNGYTFKPLFTLAIAMLIAKFMGI